jgi:hypothetical protein
MTGTRFTVFSLHAVSASSDSIPYPKYSKHRVPRVLSPEEVAQLIDAASNLQARYPSRKTSWDACPRQSQHSITPIAGRSTTWVRIISRWFLSQGFG